MRDIIFASIKKASLRYCKGIPRGMNLWDEKQSLSQKADDIARELFDMGYRIVRFEDKEPTPVVTPKIIENVSL